MVDPQSVPRFAGVATFMRRPHVYDLGETEADAAFLGVPFDDHRVRFVTHLDVDDGDVDRAVEAVERAV